MRAMMAHPAVVAVNVSSTQWSQNFVSYLQSAGLGNGGYAIPVGSASQLNTLPWTNINQVLITFNENVVIEAADLSVSGVSTVAYPFSAFSYNPATLTATWTLAAPIANDKLMLDLEARGMAAGCQRVDRRRAGRRLDRLPEHLPLGQRAGRHRLPFLVRTSCPAMCFPMVTSTAWTPS